MFILSMHPFDDGNGRVSPRGMNAELVNANQSRIIIPTVYRDEYLSGLRNMSRQHDPEALISTLDFAQRFVASVDWTDYDRAERQLRSVKAFEFASADAKLSLRNNAERRRTATGADSPAADRCRETHVRDARGKGPQHFIWWRIRLRQESAGKRTVRPRRPSCRAVRPGYERGSRASGRGRRHPASPRSRDRRRRSRHARRCNAWLRVAHRRARTSASRVIRCSADGATERDRLEY